MSKRFCTNCGAQFVEGTAFCTSCGAPAAAGAPDEAGVQPPPADAPPPPPQEAPPPVAAPPPVTGPLPPGGPAAARPAGLSRATLIGIVVVGALVVLIVIFVQRSEREFQRQRRANQTSLGTTGLPSRPNGASSYGGFNSGGAMGSDGWLRNQIVGRWTETGNCTDPIEFRADGTTGSGRWAFGGGRLSLIESSGTAVVELVSVGTQEMVLADISTRRQRTWRRC